MAGETIVLGKNVTYTGVSNVSDGSITTTFTEIDKTKSGDTERTIIRGWAEQTLDLTCIDAPGVSVGSVVTVTATGAPPRQHDAARHLRLRSPHLLDIKLETHAAFITLRQCRHHAGQCDVTTLPFARQRVCHADMRQPRGPGKSASQSRRENNDPAQNPTYTTGALQQQHQQRPGGQPSRPGLWRQCRLQLQQPDPDRK